MEASSGVQNLEESWRMVLSQLQLDLSSIAFKTWFSGSKLAKLEEGVATITFNKAYKADYVESHYRNIVKRAMSKALGNTDLEPLFDSGTETGGDDYDYTDPIFSSVANNNTSSEVSEAGNMEQQARYQPQTTVNTGTKPVDNFEELVHRAGLNSRYKFENFIVGGSTQLAHAAALAVADAPGFAYNPLFIYGGVGLGKTHLLQAIGVEILRKKPSMNVLYVPGETFLHELITAIRTAKNLEFREKYRSIDVLIIDDIQIISDKEKTQDELFHTYNVLYQSNKQIVFAADRPPSEIQNLTDRLRSRFEGGMVADIKSPDFETRLAILQKKAQDKNLFLPDYILRVIANLEIDNVRELEGSLVKIGTHFYLNNKTLTDEEIHRILKKDIESKRKSIKPKDILAEVSKVFGVSTADLKGKRRTANLAMARQVVMYLLRTELAMTLEDCAHEVKRKDHTTVLHAVDKIEDNMNADKAFAEKIGEVRKSLNKAKNQLQN
jgi:chromosomal replication initiator protein